MKKLICFTLFLLCSAMLCTAQVPGSVSYQGFLTTNGVDPVADGNYDLTFTFYNGASPVLARGPINTSVSKGIFSVIIGGGLSGSTNEPIPLTDLNFWNRPLTVGIKIGAGAELSPKTTLTAVPYSFTAGSVDNVHVQDLMDGTLSGSKVGTGISASNLTSGTIGTTLLDADLQDLADGELTGSKVGTGVNAANVTTGTLSSTRLDADLQDLADGSLDGTKVGAGISAANITTGTLDNARLDTDLQDLADGSLDGGKIGSGISATNITTGSLVSTVLDADLQDLADGSLDGTKVGTGINAANISTGTLSNTRLDTDLQDLADGSLEGAKVGTGINAANVSTGTLPNTVLDSDLQDLADDGTITNLSVSTTANISTTLAGIRVGNSNTADGDYSVAIGSYARLSAVSDGSVFIGDRSYASQASLSQANTFFARFNGGYIFYTTNNTAGVYMNAGGTSWISISDSTKKENFKPVDGQAILQKIRNMKLGTWNYTFNDKRVRHYGPYAQEFYAAFGEDGIGQVGSDTAIASQDIAGLNLTAIKQLVIRTDELREAQQKLKDAQTAMLTKTEEIDNLKHQVTQLKALLELQSSSLASELQKLKGEIEQMRSLTADKDYSKR